MISPAWPAERVERLRVLWREGGSGQTIADTLNREFRGACYTRSAVIAKGFRIGLPKRSDASRKSAESINWRAKHGSLRADRQKMRLINLAVESRVLSHMKAFEPLQNRTPVPFGSKGCKWPVGGEGAQMLCCGAQQERGLPYCAEHWRAAHEPFSPKAAKTGNQLARQLRRYVA